MNEQKKSKLRELIEDYAEAFATAQAVKGVRSDYAQDIYEQLGVAKDQLDQFIEAI